MKQMSQMKEMMITAAMLVGVSANAQVMIGDINDTTVSITDTPSGCVVLYMNWGKVVRQDTTETIPNNYNHFSGAFPAVKESQPEPNWWIKLNKWCIANANTNYSGRYYSSHKYDGVVYRHISPNSTVTTTRYGNTFRTTVVRH